MQKAKLKDRIKQNKANIFIEGGYLYAPYEIHTHDFCELVFIVSGKGKHIVGDKEFDLRKGDIFVLKGNEQHGFYDVDNLQLFNIMFNVYNLQTEDCQNIPGFLVLFVHEQTSDFLAYMNVSGMDYDKVLAWCNLMFQEYTTQSAGYISVCHSVLMQLIVFLSRGYQTLVQDERHIDLRIAKALVYLQTNFVSKITVESLAEMVGFSKRHFSRLFHQMYGVSPIQLLNEIRLEHAKDLLKNGSCSVTEVAAQCGFQDGNYFSRVYKEKYGHAPSESKNIMNTD